MITENYNDVLKVIKQFRKPPTLLSQKEIVKRINELSKQKIKLQNQIDKLKEKFIHPKEEQLNLEDFLNLSKNTAVIVQSANAVGKDQICRKIFLNLIVDNEKVLTYQAKEPFATLLKQRELLTSADERSRTSTLFKAQPPQGCVYAISPHPHELSFYHNISNILTLIILIKNN